MPKVLKVAKIAKSCKKLQSFKKFWIVAKCWKRLQKSCIEVAKVAEVCKKLLKVGISSSKCKESPKVEKVA